MKTPEERKKEKQKFIRNTKINKKKEEIKNNTKIHEKSKWGIPQEYSSSY